MSALPPIGKPVGFPRCILYDILNVENRTVEDGIDFDALNSKIAAMLEKNRELIRNGIDTEGQNLDGWTYKLDGWTYKYDSTAPEFIGAIEI